MKTNTDTLVSISTDTLSVAYNRDVRIAGWLAITGPALIYGWSIQNTYGNANLQIHFHDAINPSLNTTPLQMLFIRNDNYSEYHTKPILVQNGLYIFATADQSSTISGYSTNTAVGQANVIIYYKLV